MDPTHRMCFVRLYVHSPNWILLVPEPKKIKPTFPEEIPLNNVKEQTQTSFPGLPRSSSFSRSLLLSRSVGNFPPTATLLYHWSGTFHLNEIEDELSDSVDVDVELGGE